MSSEELQTIITCKGVVCWGPREPLTVEEIQVDPPKASEVRVRILYASICHTDIKRWHGEPHALYPRVLGHEGVGVVESVGEGVKDFEKGDLVIPTFIGECRECLNCKSGKTNVCLKYPASFDGLMPDKTSRMSVKGQKLYHLFSCSTFCQFMVVNVHYVVKVDPRIDLPLASLLSCSFSTGLGLAWKEAEIEKGSSIAVIGLGGVGIGAVAGARLSGARRIIGVDLNEYKKDKAKAFGMTDFINPKDLNGKSLAGLIREMTGGQGVEYCFECVGEAGLLSEALQATTEGRGVAVMVGIPGTPLQFASRTLLPGRTLKGSLFGGIKPQSDLPSIFGKCIKKVGSLSLRKSTNHGWQNKRSSIKSDISRSGLSEASSNTTTTNSKLTRPATPRSSSKSGRTASAKSESDSPSPLQNARLSIDKSPRSVDSKPTIERRSPKTSTAPDKQPRVLKGTELQAQLTAVQEDLKKAKEKLASLEKEKLRALEELKDAKRAAEEINEKLAEALVAQKKAEESLEIEKFRADELEQVGIEATQKREDEWKKEIESVRSQHAVDVAALLSVTQELQKVKNELGMVIDAKNTALSHADDAMKIAEINADKVEFLSGEVNRLKSLLDSELESKSTEAAELVKKLDSEVEALKDELERAKGFEEKLHKLEALMEDLKIELADAKVAESDATNLVDEWKRKAELLEARLGEANESEKSSRESLALITKKLDESNVLLQDAESEIAALKGKIESLEIEVASHVANLKESDLQLNAAQQEAVEIGKQVEVLKSEIKIVEEAKMQAINNEKAAASDIKSLTEEKNKLINELEMAGDEGEKVKKAMEGLASALHEVSTEARETQEKLLAKQAEAESADAHIKELKLELKNTQEKYVVMLDEAKYELVCLKNTVEKQETDFRDSRAEWDEKEFSFVSTIKTLEEEMSGAKEELLKVSKSLKGTEDEARAAKEDGAALLNKLKQAESEITVASKALEEAKSESLRLKERLLDKENELQNIFQENDDLRLREQAALLKVKELSDQLSEAQTKKSHENEAIEKATAESMRLKETLLVKENALLSITQENNDLRCRETAALEKVKELSAQISEAKTSKSEENGNLSSSEKDYDLPQRTIEIPEENMNASNVKENRLEEDSRVKEEGSKEENKLIENGNGNSKEEEEEQVEVEANKDLKAERETEDESVDDEVDANGVDQTHGLQSENIDNGGVSPTGQKQQQKKKKALLQKFGSLLKKKSNHK